MYSDWYYTVTLLRNLNIFFSIVQNKGEFREKTNHYDSGFDRNYYVTEPLDV